MDCIKMALLISKRIMHSTELGINLLAMQCNVRNDITRNHIAEHICELLSYRLHVHFGVERYRIYWCDFCHKSCLHNWAYTSKQVLLILQMHGDMHILLHQWFLIWSSYTSVSNCFSKNSASYTAATALMNVKTTFSSTAMHVVE